jgi:hypothetical protein
MKVAPHSSVGLEVKERPVLLGTIEMFLCNDAIGFQFRLFRGAIRIKIEFTSIVPAGTNTQKNHQPHTEVRGYCLWVPTGRL